jgi:hypothetical protein
MIRWFDPSVEHDMPHHTKDIVHLINGALATARGGRAAELRSDLAKIGKTSPDALNLLSVCQMHVNRADASAPLFSALESLSVSENGNAAANSTAAAGGVIGTWDEGLTAVRGEREREKEK